MQAGAAHVSFGLILAASTLAIILIVTVLCHIESLYQLELFSSSVTQQKTCDLESQN